MKRETAIALLNNLRAFSEDDDEPAIDMAIEALKDVHNCVHCEHYTEVETDTGIHGECKMDTAHRGDLISRQDAIDAVRNAEVLISYDAEWSADVLVESVMEQTRDCGRRAIESLPSRITEYKTFCGVSIEEAARIVQEHNADQKTGKWVKAVKHGVLSYADVYAECDQCHKVTFNGWNSNYCPNCGARMLGEDGKS